MKRSTPMKRTALKRSDGAARACSQTHERREPDGMTTPCV